MLYPCSSTWLKLLCHLLSIFLWAPSIKYSILTWRITITIYLTLILSWATFFFLLPPSHVSFLQERANRILSPPTPASTSLISRHNGSETILMMLKMVKSPIPKTSWTKSLLNYKGFVTLTQVFKVPLKLSHRTLWPFWMIRIRNSNLPIIYQLPMALSLTQINRWNFLHLRVISSRQLILTIQNIRLMTEKFGMVLPITYVVFQLTNTNWGGTTTLWKPAALASAGWKVRMLPALLCMTRSLLLRKMCPTSSPSSLNPPTQLTPLLASLLISLRYMALMLSWQILSENLETTILSDTWYLMPFAALVVAQSW